jgi:hypothetical protein
MATPKLENPGLARLALDCPEISADTAWNAPVSHFVGPNRVSLALLCLALRGIISRQ